MATAYEHITLTDLRFDLAPDPAFTRSAVARAVKAMGGKYSECRGYSDFRSVHIAPEHPEAASVLAQLLELQAARKSYSKDYIVIHMSARLMNADNSYRSDQAYIVTRQLGSETAAQILDRARAHMLKLAQARLVPGEVGWPSDPVIQAKSRQAALEAAERRVASLRDELASAEQELAQLRAVQS